MSTYGQAVEPAAGIFAPLVDDLVDNGWSICHNVLPAGILQALKDEARLLWQGEQFRQARVGRGAESRLAPEIRADHVWWLDAETLTPAAAYYWQAMDHLRRTLNQAFFLGLHDLEAHLAVYPPGAFYKRHLDQFKASSLRTISCILYLNEAWQASDGGQLRIYHDEDGSAFTDVWPEMGTFVCFNSATIYHEVLPAHRHRWSLTGWLRRAS